MATEVQPFLFSPVATHWIPVKTSDATVNAVVANHYSVAFSAEYRKSSVNTHDHVGPGERLVLRTADGKAAFAWRLCREGGKGIRGGYEGVYCVFFRNEGYHILSSELVREAVGLAAKRWPEERKYFTFVHADSVASSNPGYCFQKAGWMKVGKTKGRGLQILEYIRE